MGDYRSKGRHTEKCMTRLVGDCLVVDIKNIIVRLVETEFLGRFLSSSCCEISMAWSDFQPERKSARGEKLTKVERAGLI